MTPPEAATTVAGQPVVTPPQLPPYVVARGPKSPGLALVLSLFPGMGQLYNGQVAKSFAFFGAFVTAIWLTAESDGMPFGFFIPFILFYGLIDAWRSATVINARSLGRPVETELEDDSDSPAWGIVLVSIGLLLLVNNLGWLRLASMQRFWPVILIVAGLYFVRRAMARRAIEAPREEPRHDETV